VNRENQMDIAKAIIMEKTGGASTWWKNFVFNALLYLEPVRRHRCSSFNHFYTSRYGGLGSFKVTEIGTDLPYKSRCVVLLVCELQQPNSHFPPFPRHCDKKFRNHSFYAVFLPTLLSIPVFVEFPGELP